jgi:hypothetical protein
VNWLSEFIYLAGLKYDGFVADTTNGQPRSRHGHGVPLLALIESLQAPIALFLSPPRDPKGALKISPDDGSRHI